MPKILLASAKWYHITAAESWAGGGKAAVKQAGMDMNSFNCIINRGQICSCQLYVMKKLGEGAEKGIQKPASRPWNVSLGMLNTRRAVICQGLSSGAEWKMRCCERAGRASLLRKFWSGSLQTQRKVNINSLFHETWQLTCKFLVYLGATQSGLSCWERQVFSESYWFEVPQVEHIRKTDLEKWSVCPKLLGSLRHLQAADKKSIQDFLKKLTQKFSGFQK